MSNCLSRTQGKNFNCKLTKRQLYKTGFSTGKPNSWEISMWTKFQILISKHFWDWSAGWGDSRNYTCPENHAMRVQKGPGLHVVTTPDSSFSQQDLSSFFLHILFKRELLRTVCLDKDFQLWWRNTSNVSCSENITGITNFSISFITHFLWPGYERHQ